VGRALVFLFGIEVRKLLEPRKSLIDLFASQSLHSLRAETFHGKGTHHAPIKHSSLELSRSDLRLRRQVAEKSARKRVARARWIDHFSQRQCWSAEESVVNAAGKRVFSKESGSAVLPMLHDQRLWAHFHDVFRRAHQVGVVAQQLGFAIVDEQNIQTFHHRLQIFFVTRDPVVHGVAANHAYLRHLLTNLLLQRWVDIGKKKKFAVPVGFGNFGLKSLEYIQVRAQRLCFVQVLEIFASPVETFACGVFDAVSIDPSRTKNRFLLFSKVFPDYPNYANLRKETCGQGKVGGSAAQATICGAARGLDTVECDRTNYKNRHRGEHFPKQNLCDSTSVIEPD